jgi:hypothetical protein
VSITVVKFHQGGYITIIITGALVAVAVSIKRHYALAAQLLARLDELVRGAETIMSRMTKSGQERAEPKFDTHAKTAVVLVNGFNGLGLHCFLSVQRLFGGTFKNFAFVQIGLVDAGNFKGVEEVEKLDEHVGSEVDRYVQFARLNGYYAEGFSSVGVDIVEEMALITPKILERFPNAVFFGGQMVFPEETLWTRWLHNFVVFAVQRRLYREGVPFVILPVRV